MIRAPSKLAPSQLNPIPRQQELKDDCARTKAAASADAETRRRIHERRCLRTYTDGKGAANLHMRDNPEVVAEIMAAVGPRRDRIFAQARAQGRRVVGGLRACMNTGSRSPRAVAT